MVIIVEAPLCLRVKNFLHIVNDSLKSGDECVGACHFIILMCMGVPTPHTRVTISGFEWWIGQNNPGQGQSFFPLKFVARKALF